MTEHILNLDKPRKLKFGFKASRLLKEKFKDKDIEALSNMSVHEFPIIAWCGLVWEDESLTPERVEEIIDEKIPDEYTVTGIIELLSNAIMDHMGVDLKKLKEEAEKDEKKKKKRKVTKRIPSKKAEKQPSK